MNINLVTKIGNDGRSLIDRDKSFTALIDELESLYQSLFDDNPELYQITLEIIEAPNLLSELIREINADFDRDNEENATFPLLVVAIFKIANPEHRDVNFSIKVLEEFEKIHPTAEAYLLLGFLHCCAPGGMTQNKSLALSFFDKVSNPDNIFLSDTDDVKASAESAIEAIKASGEGASKALVKIENPANKTPTSTLNKNFPEVKAPQENNSGVWAAVINVALNALSKFSSDKLNDPIFMRKALGKAYELLPFWVRMVVSEDVFFNFCFDRRALLINKLDSGTLNVSIDEDEYYLPKDNEQPQISKETLLVNIVDRHSGNLFSEEKFYFFPGIGSEKFMNAYNSYAKEALERVGLSTSGSADMLGRALKSVGVLKDSMPEGVGIPLFMYDSTAFGSCKTGFIITTEMLIVKEMMTKPTLVKLGHVDKFEIKKSFMSAGKIYINNECIIDCNQGKKESFQKFSAMFNEILDLH